MNAAEPTMVEGPRSPANMLGGPARRERHTQDVEIDSASYAASFVEQDRMLTRENIREASSPYWTRMDLHVTE